MASSAVPVGMKHKVALHQVLLHTSLCTVGQGTLSRFLPNNPIPPSTFCLLKGADWIVQYIAVPIGRHWMVGLGWGEERGVQGTCLQALKRLRSS